MDYASIIASLTLQIERLEEVIGILEGMEAKQRKATTGSNAGRKSMDPVERQEVSRRMKQYWQAHRRESSRKSSASPGSTADD